MSALSEAVRELDTVLHEIDAVDNGDYGIYNAGVRRANALIDLVSAARGVVGSWDNC